MILKAMDIIWPKDVRNTINILQEHGYSAYVVGPAVRDSILHKNVEKYDITTDANDFTVKALFDNIPLIVNIIPDIKPMQIPLNISYTIDSLVATLNGNIYDQYNGLQDIENKIIALIPKVEDLFEARLYHSCDIILYTLASSAQLGFKISDNIKQKIIKNKIYTLSILPENRFKYFKLIMGCDDSHFLAKLLWEYREIFSTLIWSLDDTLIENKAITHHNAIIYKHLCNVVANVEIKDSNLRLAAFLHDIGKPKTFMLENGKATFYQHDKIGASQAQRALKALGYPEEDIKKICRLIQYHNDPSSVNLRWIRRNLKKFEGDDKELRKLFILKLADARDHTYFQKWQYNKFNQLNQLLDEEIERTKKNENTN